MGWGGNSHCNASGCNGNRSCNDGEGGEITPVMSHARGSMTLSRIRKHDLLKIRQEQHLPPEGFGISLETQGKQTFWRETPGFWMGYPRGARKVLKHVCVYFLACMKDSEIMLW